MTPVRIRLSSIVFSMRILYLLIILFFQQSVAFERQRSFANFVSQNRFKRLSDVNSQFGDAASENRAFGNEIPQKNDQMPLEKNNVEATSFEIKALLTKCLKSRSCDCESSFECVTNDTENANLKTKDARTKCEEQADDKVLRNCEKKISLTLKIKNRGITNRKPQYIILDHVFDAETDKKQKLLNPYVLKIMQRPVYQIYDLIYENIVNSGPSERVVNKNNEGYSGCSTDPSNPTCGSVQYNNKEVPYSTGFCCPCSSPRGTIGGTGVNSNYNSNTADSSNGKVEQSNDQVIDPRDLSNVELANLNVPSINGGAGLKETNMPFLPEYNKIDYGHDGFIDKEVSIKDNDVPINSQNLMHDNLGPAPRIRRQASLSDITGGINKRGGQDCSDKYTPPYADPNTYHESTHCMEFSDVWYSIYKIAHPDIEHSLDIQIFEKIGMNGNNIYWREVTSSGKISVGTSNQRYANDDGTILAYYTVDKQIESEFALDCKSHLILIPEITGRYTTEDQYPEVRGGPAEYLVVREGDIDLSGKTCNKAGVGYEAFVRQPRKCSSERNSCLQNQPKQMWQHDHDLEANGKRGCYFLKNFGILPENPVRMKPCNGSSKKSQNKLLYMHYLPCLTSSVNINFAANMNVILRSDTSAMITEVYTETLNPKRVTITAKILNSGLVTSIFYVAIGACPMDIPASFGSITSQSVLIAPQHQHTFTLEIYCELTIKSFYCSLEVFNMKQQLVSVRRIRYERTDRCICVWYCQCTCFRSGYGLKCNPLEIEQYHAAGFQGGMPIATQVVSYSELDDTISVFLHVILYFCLTLWYMSLIKATLGCCILPIGLWGLDKILDLPKQLNKYYETELKDQRVVYDDEGWPVHPETGKKVNNIAPPTQFAINMVFFFIFPFAILWNLCKKLLAPKYSTDQMFSDLDICKCKASQISMLKDYSLQNSTLKNSSSSQQKETDFDKDGQLKEDPSKGGYSNSQTDSKTDGNQDRSKKKSKGCLSFHCKRKGGDSNSPADSKIDGNQDRSKKKSKGCFHSKRKDDS